MNNQREEFEKAVAAQRSFISASILIFFLYWLFYIPGLVSNILYFREARNKAKFAGKKPSGYNILIFLFMWGVIPFVTSVILLAKLGIISSSTLAPFTYIFY
jgi:hypothetical protein